MDIVSLIYLMMCYFFVTGANETKPSTATISVTRVLPSIDNYLVFKDDVIKATCTITNQNGVENITWQYYDRYSGDEIYLGNNTGVKIINIWNKDGMSMSSVLEILDVPKSKMFFYRCIAEYKDGTTGKKLLEYNYISEKDLPKVNVNESIVSNKKVSSNDVILGSYNSSMKFKCKLNLEKNEKLANGRVIVELTVNGIKVESTPSVLYEHIDNLLLQYNITSLLVDDGGVYRCLSKLQIGKRNFFSSKNFNLTFPLQLTGQKHSSINSFRGQDVEIVCDIESYPMPKWTFLHESKDVGNITNLTVTDNRLEIEFVTKEHAGLYTCIGEDQNGNTKTQNISLFVIDIDNETCNKASKVPHYFFGFILVFTFVLFYSNL